MAVRLDASTDRLLRTSNIPSYDANYSVLFWFYFPSRPSSGTYATIFAIDDNNDDADFITIYGSSASDTRLNLGGIDTNTFFEQTGTTNLSPNTWYCCGLRRTATNSRIAYIGTLTSPLAQEINFTGNLTARTTASRMEFGAIFSSNLDPYDGRVDKIKIWSVARTVSELTQEQYSILPVFTDNLVIWSPTFPGSGERKLDYSGNGYNWTEGGTLTDEDPAPVSWGARPIVLPWVDTGGSPIDLVVQDATHAHTADNIDLTQEGTLVVQDATHDHSAESPTLTQVHNLAVQDATHAHSAESPDVTAAAYALRFYGNGTSNIDRVRIPLDTGGTSTAADVGAGDATYETWIKFDRADNTADITGGGDARNSNIFFDRDIWGHPRGWVMGLTRSGSNTFVCWGCADISGNWTTIIGNTNVGDGNWHHVAFTWQQSTRTIRMYVDGTEQTNTRTLESGNTNLSYPDGYDPGTGQNNPYLVLGAEKHDAGASYPSYNGYMDELRISNNRRYTGNFTRPDRVFSVESSTVALYHFDDNTGTVLSDSASGNTDGELLVGGSPSGPAWVVSTLLLGGPDGTLVVQDASHAHTADNVTLTQVHNLAVQDAAHDHTVDNLTLTQVHILVVADAGHDHSAESPTLTQVHILVVQDATHGHTADNVDLSGAANLTVQDAAHDHTADNVTLTQVHILVVQDAAHAHTVDNVELSGAVNLVVQDALHAHTADNLALTQAHNLVVADALHAHAVDNLVLTQVHILVVQDALHLHTADQAQFYQEREHNELVVTLYITLAVTRVGYITLRKEGDFSL